MEIPDCSSEIHKKNHCENRVEAEKIVSLKPAGYGMKRRDGSTLRSCMQEQIAAPTTSLEKTRSTAPAWLLMELKRQTGVRSGM